MTSRTYSMLTAALLTATAASAQGPASAASPVQAAPPAAAVPARPGDAPAPSGTDSPAYTYDTQGRRDPFVSLLRRGTQTDRTRQAMRAAGISGLETTEVVLKGTMQSRTGYVALVESSDKKTYILKSGDRLADGTVRTITPEGMVILQQVNDPLSLEKQREIRKMLRQTEEVK